MALPKPRKIPIGFGVWLLASTGAPVDGTSGTFAGVAGPSSIYFRYDTGAAYINTGTKASPTWKAITHA